MVHINTYNKLSLFALFSVVSTGAIATEPAAMDFDWYEVTPALEVAGTSDGNFQATRVARHSNILRITPSVNVIIYGENATFEIDYRLESKRFTAPATSDLTSHYLNGKARVSFDVRNNLTITARFDKTEGKAAAFIGGLLNRFITVDAGGSYLSGNDFSAVSIGAKYIYGAPSATGNVELGFDNLQVRSDNGANLLKEFDARGVSATFKYRATDKTALTVDLLASRAEYVSNFALNSTNIAYLVGTRWRGAFTKGHVSIGVETKDFDHADKENASLAIWELNAEWAPLTYSVIKLTSHKKLDEGSYDSSYIEIMENQVEWMHDWGRGYSSHLIYANAETNFSGIRFDSVNLYEAGIKYEVRRWVDISFDYHISNRRSTDFNYKFDRDKFSVSLNLSL